MLSEIHTAIEELRNSIHNFQISIDANFQATHQFPPSSTTSPSLYSLPSPQLPPIASTPHSNVDSTTIQIPPDPSLSRLPIRRLSPAKIEELNDRGLCYNCEQIWSDTHRCRIKCLILFGTDEEDEFDDMKSPRAEVETTVEDLSNSDILLDSESPPPPIPKSEPYSIPKPPPPPPRTLPPSLPRSEQPWPPSRSRFHPPLSQTPPPPIPSQPTEPPPPDTLPLPATPPPKFHPPYSSLQIFSDPPCSSLSTVANPIAEVPLPTPQLQPSLFQTPPLPVKELSSTKIDEQRERMLCDGADQKFYIFVDCHGDSFWPIDTKDWRESDSLERILRLQVSFIPPSPQVMLGGEPPPILSLI